MRGHVPDEDRHESPLHAACHYTAVMWMAEIKKRERPDYSPQPLPAVIREAVKRAEADYGDV
jgi:hypothetical protein